MYRVGNVIFDILNVKNDNLIKGLADFRVASGVADIVYEIVYVDDFSEFKIGDLIYGNESIAIERIDRGLRYYYLVDNSIYAIKDELGSHDYIYLCNDALDADFHRYFLPSLFCLERELINQQSFFFHSSYISYHNQAILFTAPSGGGKSTQADLWMQYKGAKILNGDRNTVGKEDASWFVYGTPFSGSSKYCVNKTTPLKAIIILEKGPVNMVKRLDIRGFNRVFSQVTVNTWDKDFCNRIMDLVMHLCNDVPVYIYSCKKDESAVEYLYNVLVKDGVIDGFSK